MTRSSVAILLALQVFSVHAAQSEAPASPALKAEASAPPAFKEEAKKQSAIYQSRGAERPEGYVIDRSLLSYTHILPDEFVRSLGSLGANDRWLDIGAGEGRAILDYCTSKYDVLQSKGGQERPPGEKAKAVAMSIEDRRTPQWHQTAANPETGKIEDPFGKPLGEYATGELGQFQVITDVLGGFSYTPRLTHFMEKTLALLPVNGNLYTVLQDVRGEAGTNKPHYAGASYLTEIVRADGSDVGVCRWLKSISCVEVTCEFKEGFTPPVEVYRVHKVCEKVTVPTLVPTHFEAGTPPERRFRVANPPAAVTVDGTAR